MDLHFPAAGQFSGVVLVESIAPVSLSNDCIQNVCLVTVPGLAQAVWLYPALTEQTGSRKSFTGLYCMCAMMEHQSQLVFFLAEEEGLVQRQCFGMCCTQPCK